MDCLLFVYCTLLGVVWCAWQSDVTTVFGVNGWMDWMLFVS
jgi:hypothetical protein